MTEIEKEIIQKQVVYEITKEELDAIKREERNKGKTILQVTLHFLSRTFI